MPPPTDAQTPARATHKRRTSSANTRTTQKCGRIAPRDVDTMVVEPLGQSDAPAGVGEGVQADAVHEGFARACSATVLQLLVGPDRRAVVSGSVRSRTVVDEDEYKCSKAAAAAPRTEPLTCLPSCQRQHNQNANGATQPARTHSSTGSRDGQCAQQTVSCHGRAAAPSASTLLRRRRFAWPPPDDVVSCAPLASPVF
jgi:hypothetical protein